MTEIPIDGSYECKSLTRLFESHPIYPKIKTLVNFSKDPYYVPI